MKWLKQVFALEPARVATVAGLVYAASAMLYHAEVAHTGVIQPDVLVAAVTAVWGLVTRALVTPLAKPRDAKGRALKPSQVP